MTDTTKATLPKLDVAAARLQLQETIVEKKAAVQKEVKTIRGIGKLLHQADILDSSQSHVDMRISEGLIAHNELIIINCSKAIRRIDGIGVDEYGICTSCFEEIELGRLSKMPESACCSTCANTVELKSKHIMR